MLSQCLTPRGNRRSFSRTCVHISAIKAFKRSQPRTCWCELLSSNTPALSAGGSSRGSNSKGYTGTVGACTWPEQGFEGETSWNPRGGSAWWFAASTTRDSQKLLHEGASGPCFCFHLIQCHRIPQLPLVDSLCILLALLFQSIPPNNTGIKFTHINSPFSTGKGCKLFAFPEAGTLVSFLGWLLGFLFGCGFTVVGLFFIFLVLLLCVCVFFPLLMLFCCCCFLIKNIP